MIVDQVADPMIALLVVAAIVSGVVGEPADTVVITVIVLLNAVIGVVQERRAEQAMAALRAMSAPTAVVVRDGVEQQVDAAGLVPGDVVVLQDGAIVPADLRLLSIASLRIAEAALTGESQPVGKRVEPVGDPHAPVGDRRSMAFRGTFVTQGRGRGIVVGTGKSTELGTIAGLLLTADVVRTPLQRRLSSFGGRIALAVIAICAIVFLTGLLRGEDPGLMFLTAISLAVAAVPEALPAVVAVTLALGARRMAHHNALVRRLPAVETLGSVTWICSDKTGTLTENRMHVEVLEPASTRRRRGALVTPGPSPTGRPWRPWSTSWSCAMTRPSPRRPCHRGPHGDRPAGGRARPWDRSRGASAGPSAARRGPVRLRPQADAHRPRRAGRHRPHPGQGRTGGRRRAVHPPRSRPRRGAGAL